MKLLLTVLFLFNGFIAFSQTKNDDGLADFIRSKYYIQLTDTVHLPKTVLPYLHLITDNLLAAKYATPAEAYVNAAYVMDYNTEMKITVINIQGIRALKREEDENLKLKDTSINGRLFRTEHIVLGNPGNERELVINKADGSIVTHLFQ